MRETDAELVALAREGEEAAFAELVRRYMRPAYLVALSQLGNDADAEDVSQDAFLIALRQLETCRNPERFGSWFLTIVRNRARNFRRDRTTREGVPIEDALGLAARGDTSHAAEVGELRGRLLEALKHLTPTQREALLLFDVEGLRHAEIGEQLGISEGNARYHVFQARRRMRELLGPVHEEG